MSLNHKKLFLALTLGIGSCLAGQTVVAQLLDASRPISDPADRRFDGVKEDFTVPGLNTSHLKAAPPLVAYINEHQGYTVELLQLQWRWGDPLDVYVMKPSAVKKPPVILYLYGFPADTDTFQSPSFQEAVTRDGFAAVGFVSALTGHRYHGRPMKEWFVSELPESLTVTAHDVQMILDYLTTRGDLDMDRVGMFTQGSGASIGILTAASEPRIKVLDTLDPWADWPTWLAKTPVVPEDERKDLTNPEFLKRTAALDPVAWLPKIQARKFRLQTTLFDSDTPLASKEKLQAVVPVGATVVRYKTAEEFMAAFRRGKNIEWLQRELRLIPEPQSHNGGDSSQSNLGTVKGSSTSGPLGN